MIRNSKGEAPVKLAVVLVVLIVAAGVVVALKPWGWFSSGGTVRFYSRVYFYLIETEDNGPLENVEIWLPDPNIDNKALEPRTTYVPDGAFWTLYAYTDNGLVVEIDHGDVVQLVAPRTSAIDTTGTGYAPQSHWGPKFGFMVDVIYPNEILEVRQWFEIPADKANSLTLGDTSPGPYPTNALIYSDPAKAIDGSFFAGLYRANKDNTLQKVEEFGWTFENELTQAWWGLESI